jgi:hypothetical protein
MLLKTRLHEHLFQLLETRISELSVQRTQISHDSTESGKGSVFCLSPEAPLYLALNGKKVGETALLNGKTWKIETVS